VNWTRPLHKTLLIILCSPGADPGFQVGGGDALKKIAPSGGKSENFWGISCEKSRFYAKKILFFPILGGGARRVHPAPEYVHVDMFNLSSVLIHQIMNR
jgi:hypothetical protein